MNIKLPGKIKVASHIIDRPPQPLIVSSNNGNQSIVIQTFCWKQSNAEWLMIITGVMTDTQKPFSGEIKNSDGTGTIEVTE